MKRGKFNNKRFFYNPQSREISSYRTSENDLYFQSFFEFDVYKSIRVNLSNCRYRLTPQAQVLVKPATANFSALHWAVDFRVDLFAQEVIRPNMPPVSTIFVEAKGKVLEMFDRNVQYLEFFNPDQYRQLILVSKTRLDYGIPCLTLPEFHAYLRKVQNDYLVQCCH